MPKMPARFPAPRTTPPVKFKAESINEHATRVSSEKADDKALAPAKPMSNKEIALVLLATHVQDSFLRLTDVQMAVVAGKVLRGERPLKVREFYRTRVEKLLASTMKLLEKRKLQARVTSFYSEPPA